MSIEDTLKQLAKVVDQFQEMRKDQIEAMAEHIEEAEKKLKEAREVSEVKLSDLPEEEWESCKGMWVRGKNHGGEAIEGIIFGFYEDGALVLVPGESYHCWRRPDHLILLPDYQRAFAVDGGPVRVDPGQWEKTRGMEDEFDRIKKENPAKRKLTLTIEIVAGDIVEGVE